MRLILYGLKCNEMAKQMSIKEMNFLSMIYIIFYSFQYKEIMIIYGCLYKVALMSSSIFLYVGSYLSTSFATRTCFGCHYCKMG